MILDIKITVFKDVLQCSLVEVSAFQRNLLPQKMRLPTEYWEQVLLCSTLTGSSETLVAVYNGTLI